MIRRPPRSTLSSSSAASDVYKRQVSTQSTGTTPKKMRARVITLVLLIAAATAVEYRVRTSQIPGTMFLDSCEQVHLGCKYACPDQAKACEHSSVCDWCSADSTLRCMKPPDGCASEPSMPWGPHLPKTNTRATPQVQVN
eukprot:TRINITY_DN6187_c0_g1_i2.p1 TRINITY_DN6187_c0_g1~~TRINITY_DN6187_c0_g1_i2.p1  ORF type:complete len:140 (+),score=20.27 TRINITY_DN6187_c0_g1_i2:112-531(+)